MNPRTKKKMDTINNRLEEFSQSTRVIDLSAKTIFLSTGHMFRDSEAARFTKRVMNTKIDDWVKNTDNLLLGLISDEVIKAIGCSLGGKAVQKKYGDKIKQQLNTGIPWNKGLKGNYPYHYPCKQSTKEKISVKNTGSRNGMYGKNLSFEEKEKKSKKMKKLILDGEFTPNSNNRNTHWESSLDGVKYRSSWEALYKFINPDARYEDLRIEYTIDNDTKIYIVDFVDHHTRTVIEVKPEELCSGPTYSAKITALENWAKQNNYSVLIATKKFLLSFEAPIEYSRFDDNTQRKIRQLYETDKKN